MVESHIERRQSYHPYLCLSFSTVLLYKLGILISKPHALKIKSHKADKKLIALNIFLKVEAKQQLWYYYEESQIEKSNQTLYFMECIG